MRVLLFETQHEDGARRWAMPAREIVELVPVVRWRSVDGGPAWLLGVFERQGALVPLVDLCLRLGASAVTPRIGSRIAVTRLGDGGRNGLVGLMIESSIGLASVDFDSAAAHPGFDARPDAILGALATSDGVTIQLLRLRHVLPPEVLEAILPQAHGGVNA
ncbi:MAG: chemotaxis protein CheW [Phycisphaerales bacterium]